VNERQKMGIVKTMRLRMMIEIVNTAETGETE
jgi:hypothetical protein